MVLRDQGQNSLGQVRQRVGEAKGEEAMCHSGLVMALYSPERETEAQVVMHG